MQRADLTTRAVAWFVDLLIVIGLARLPDGLGFLSASGYILIRDGLFEGRSIGKKLIGVLVRPEENDSQHSITYRESIIRNTTFEAAYILFLIPYAGWVLGPAALAVEWLVALGDDHGMRTGDMLARTRVVQLKPERVDTRPDDQPQTTANEKPGSGVTGDQSEQSEHPFQGTHP
jgi:hypothetical protein